MNTPHPDAATNLGTTRPAGEDITDAEAIAEVAEQTSPDLKAEDLFERESDSAVTEKPATETTADDVASD